MLYRNTIHITGRGEKMAPRKKKKGKANKPTIEIVTKRIVEHGFKTTEGQNRFKSKSVTLYERRD